MNNLKMDTKQLFEFLLDEGMPEVEAKKIKGKFIVK